METLYVHNEWGFDEVQGERLDIPEWPLDTGLFLVHQKCSRNGIDKAWSVTDPISGRMIYGQWYERKDAIHLACRAVEKVLELGDDLQQITFKMAHGLNWHVWTLCQ